MLIKLLADGWRKSVLYEGDIVLIHTSLKRTLTEYSSL